MKIKTEITESLSITENDDSLINLDFEEISDVEFDEETKTKGLGNVPIIIFQVFVKIFENDCLFQVFVKMTVFFKFFQGKNFLE